MTGRTRMPRRADAQSRRRTEASHQEGVGLIEPDLLNDLGVDRPWVVLVWNDPINLMSYVAFVFQKLFGYSKAEANKLMLQVHNEGKAVVSTGDRSSAERDVFHLHEHGLWATMQQD